MPARTRGFTLMELIVVISVIGVALIMAVPSWDNASQKRLVTNGTEQVTSLLSIAQSEAIARNQAVSISFNRVSGTQWCVGATAGTGGCDCTESDDEAAAFCQLDGVAQRIGSADLPGMILQGAGDRLPGSGDGMVVFDTVRGILQPAGDGLQFTFDSLGDKYRLRVQLGPTGLIWVCSPDASRFVPGYGDCGI
jgi:prepilin-type N-terminal cleavage/methylation domain-containing protein